MNRKSFLLSIILFLIIILNIDLIKIPEIEAYYEDAYKWSSYQVNSSSDDCYYLVDYDLDLDQISMYFKVLNYDVEAGIRFQNITLMGNSTIDIAYISFYTSNQTIENDPLYFTIYGIWGNPDTFINVTDFINNKIRTYPDGININAYESLQNSGWHNISITSLVKYVVYNEEHEWVNGSLGFKTSGEECPEYVKIRTYDYDDHSKAPKLYIREKYQVEKHGGDPEDYVKTYKDYDIYIDEVVYGYMENIDYVFSSGTSSPYNISYGDVEESGKNTISISEDQATGFGNRKTIRLNNGIIYSVYHKMLDDKFQVYVSRSIDNGVTWINETRISTYEGMNLQHNNRASIGVDSNNYLHVIWYGKASGFANYQIWYALYNGTWNTPERISDYNEMQSYPQQYCSISVDPDDNIHAVWIGKATDYTINTQIWYANKSLSWSEPIRISTKETMESYEQFAPDISIDSNNYIHVVWRGETSEYFEDECHQIWYALNNGSWQIPLRISTAYGMHTHTQKEPSIDIDSNDYLHVAWSGKTTIHVNAQIYYAKKDISWSYPLRISNYTGMESYGCAYASIALDYNDYIHVLWYGKAFGFTDYDKIWHTVYIANWSVPNCLQPIGMNTFPKLGIRLINMTDIEEYHYAVYYEDKLMKTCFPTIDDAEDWIDWHLELDPEYDRLPNLGSNIMWLLGLIGLGMIPLSFIMFVYNVQQGDIMNGFYLLMILFMVGLGLVITWLWG